VRLKLLHHGHRLTQKPFLALIRALVGRVPGPIATMSYRSRLFGAGFSRCLQEAMRGDSPWSAGERELFAAFVSARNQCPY
jgi:hypothetical protein